ncbi:ChaN family lipoprotein [Desulfoprunum benzoelyticum]|uniref:Putative iron-regulated protein n=1 Tax=Desulfoprunum benzoelyticum TaxID=1506996 RepID=A0A840UQI1_9BACT|nr:ChaN family lipoprotein [Desulfoprunum benzoelyticum]MBB5348477.1 putative iron-regulated protein [Desulfoprunum benzoelyticum]MBM9530188.1 ChaN family lipoprotein [Desulfoprunum benzoelyticum]
MPSSLSFLALVLILLVELLHGSNLPAATENPPGAYDLAVSFSPSTRSLTATARITLPPATGLALELGDLAISGMLLRRADGSEVVPVAGPRGRLQLVEEKELRELYISYRRQVDGTGDDLINPDGIVLLGLWHPLPDREMRFSLRAKLPPGFIAVTESDRFPLATEGDATIAVFSQPRRNLHFVAAPYAAASREVRPGLQVHTLFFPEERELAPSYLESAAGYLQRYERQIGPFPYNHYVIVANRLPTGLGLPTFTLMGRQVLRLPFIRQTSLGHEILHSWFGNSVEVAATGGNWCEGLTTYLADHAYRADRGEAAADRKERIVTYLNHVNDNNVIPLAAFASADHRQPQAEAVRAVGYNRGALLFAELEARLGPEVFTRAIRHFYARHRGTTAGWNDLRQAFSATAGQDLAAFFTERLERTDIPDLAVEEIDIRQTASGPHLSFRLRQKTERPYSLQVPVVVTTAGGTSRFSVTAAGGDTSVSLTTDGWPLQFSIDPEYTFLRRLHPAEGPPVWSQFLGAEKKLAILQSEAVRAVYQPLLAALADDSWIVKPADEVKVGELQDGAVLFLGLDHPLSRSLFARPDLAAAGFSLDVRRNPLNSGQPAVLITSADREETAATAPKLRHYGRYSRLHFTGGRNDLQQIAAADAGMTFVLDRLPAGAATAELQPFADIIARLAANRVVFVGETHTSMADHHLQLRIIEALHRLQPDLAIGLEMFPTSSQPALDAYSSGDKSMDERSFLKASRYFQVWNQDYRLYRDIITFARSRGIPLVGLNLDKEVTSTVFKTGSTAALPEAAGNSLPVDRDLSLPGYAERLAVIHDMHQTAGHGDGSLSGFIQAQALWDEAMAEHIAEYLTRHPGRRMVVLAGTQHTRKDTGIPPRLARRLQLDQATVAALPANTADLATTVDFVFATEPVVLPDQAMIGVVLQSQTLDGRPALKVGGFTATSKADEAGLRKDDIVRAIDGLAIAEMDDVRIALLDTGIGGRIAVDVERPGPGGTMERLQLTIELVAPAGHPR